jgi:PHD/YefM family antitoxin component YafN of YafNO toxin-antitoxin module
MIDVTQVHSLTEFQRNAKDHVERLKESGKPEVLTVNGQAELVVQSAQAYQELLEDAELARSLRVIRKSLDDAKRGKTQSARAFLKSLAAKHGIELGK